MTLILTIDILVVLTLCGIVLMRGLEAALPFVAFVLVLAPEQSRIVLPGLFDLTTQRIVVFALLILYLTFHRNRDRTMRVAEMPLVLLILAQLTWAVLSTCNSVVPLLSLKKLLSQTLEYYLLYYIYVRTITRTQTVHRILHAMVSSIIVCSAFGAIQAYTGWAVTDLFPLVIGRFSYLDWEKTARGLRVWSTFPHPILFGASIAVIIPMALYLLATAKGSLRKVWLWAGIFLMFLSIYKTSSRGPWLALILGSAILFVFGLPRVRKYLVVLALISMTVLIARPGVWETIADYYVQTLSPRSPLGKSYEYRYALRRVAQSAIDQHVSRALWGYGMESFFYLHLQANFEGRPYTYLSCDSTWVLFMVETGYVGLLLMILLLFKPTWIAWSSYKQIPGPTRYTSLAILIGLGTYYFSMISVDMYSWGQDGYMLWVLIALAVAFARLKRMEASQALSSAVRGEDFLSYQPRSNRPLGQPVSLRGSCQNNMLSSPQGAQAGGVPYDKQLF